MTEDTSHFVVGNIAGSPPNAPVEETGGFTHTLIFPRFIGADGCDSVELLLGLKKRGFGAGSVNGFGGKIERGDASVRSGALRELLEETSIPLPTDSVTFAGRVDIGVHQGERVSIAVYSTPLLPRTFLSSLPEVLPHEAVEIVPFLLPISALHIEDDVPRLAKNAPVRPEHILYLPLLLAHPQTSHKTFTLDIHFNEEPHNIVPPQRPENHRTVRHWHLDVFASS